MKRVIRLTESDLTRIVKRVIMEQDFDYNSIEKMTDANMIYNTIKKAKGTFNDDEAVAEAAFIAIANSQNPKRLFEDVHELFYKKDGIGLVEFVKQILDVNKKYHKQSVNGSIQKIMASKTSPSLDVISIRNKK